MSRRDARVAAMQMMYRNRLREMPGDASNSAMMEVLDLIGNDSISVEDVRYSKALIDGVEQHVADIDAIISDSTVNWQIDRLPVVDLCILRIAIYEILYCDDVPDAVAASEAVDMAFKFSTDDSSSYINGILRSVINSKS